METIQFKEANMTLTSTDENVRDLPCFTDGKAVVCGFKLSEEELATVKETREIWLVVMHPPKMFPPVGVYTEKPIETKQNG